MYATNAAFAALKAGGGVMTWGSADGGGDHSSLIKKGTFGFGKNVKDPLARDVQTHLPHQVRLCSIEGRRQRGFMGQWRFRMEGRRTGIPQDVTCSLKSLPSHANFAEVCIEALTE